ncbi:MAG TPA: serine hydrolase [Jatrophihabitans sp.]|nr:serine hydrolase [Jatrophihabitans sp.]
MIGGNPSRPASAITLDNWQTAPHVAWSFQHIADLFPTATISRGSGPVATLPARPVDLDEIAVDLYDGTSTTVGEVINTTDTDGWLVLHNDAVLTERYPHGMPAETLHLLMSVSKSLVGTVVGALVADGTVDVAQPVTTYVPALLDSGYAGATVRHLLDMRSGIAFSEDYLDPTAEVRLLDAALGWAPRNDPRVPDSVFDFLRMLRRKSDHGGPFEYRSCESDVLGWVCEAATGTRMPELMSRVLWSRLGAEYDANIGVDSVGTGLFDGGISAALRDLARFGAMILHDGVSLTGEQLVSASWIADTLAGDPDSRAAFAACPVDNGMPGGMYRNQFWFPYPDDAVLLALGIHGQMIYINRRAQVVAAKLSHWPSPQDSAKLYATIRAFGAIAAAVS